MSELEAANTDPDTLILGADGRRIAALRFTRDLTTAAWEAEFKRRGAPVTRTGWDPGAATAIPALHFDFSRVDFVDFGVLARTLLVLDAAVRAHVPATVSLPTRAATHGEQAAIQRLIADGHPEAATTERRIKRRARHRGEARDFMRDAGFLAALGAPHWPSGAVRVLDSPISAPDEHVDDPRADEGLVGHDRTDPGASAGSFKRGQRRVLPLRWVPSPGLERTRRADHFLALEAELRDLGLSRSDAHAIGQTILGELIENVARHAGAAADEEPYALVGALLLDPDIYAERLPRTGTPRQLADLVDYAVETDSRALRVVVGDSGVGLMANRTPDPETTAEDAEDRRRFRQAPLGMARRTRRLPAAHDLPPHDSRTQARCGRRGGT